MAYIISLTAVMTGLFVFGIIVNFFTMSERLALIAKRIFLCTILGGAFACILSIALFCISAARLGDGDIRSATIGSFRLYTVASCIFTVIYTLIIIAFMNSKIRTKTGNIIPVYLFAVSPLFSFIGAFCSMMYSALTFFDGISLRGYILLFGAGMSLMTTLIPYLETKKRYSLLSDDNKREKYVYEREQKKINAKEAKETRKRIAEKRRRLAHPKKKGDK